MFFLFDLLPPHERRITLSTQLTIARFFLVPFVVFFILCHWWYSALILLVIAGLTDFFDGELARLRDERTLLGAMLDPLADKILMIASFWALASIRLPHFIIPPWFIFLLLIKELIQLVGGLLVFMWCGTCYIQPTMLGKGTMALQLAMVIWIALCQAFGCMPIKTYSVLLAVLACCVLGTFLQYSAIGLQLLVGMLKNIGDRV